MVKRPFFYFFFRMRARILRTGRGDTSSFCEWFSRLKVQQIKDRPWSDHMAKFGNILVPVDLSPRSLSTAHYVGALVDALDCRVTFLHVINRDWKLDRPEGQVRAELIEFLRGIRGSFVTQHGKTAKVIADVANAKLVDLILMSTRAPSSLTRLFKPSITAKVLRLSRRPVLAGFDDVCCEADPQRTLWLV